MLIFFFVTEEAALVNLDGKQAGKGEKIKSFSSAVQHGECVQSVEGEGKMKTCHSSLLTQHKAAAFQMKKRRLRLFIPHVPATLKPMTLISLRHQYNITCLVLLHPRESEQIDTSEKKPGDTHKFLTFIYSYHFFFYLKYSVLSE